MDAVSNRSYEYCVGGGLPVDAPTYLRRQVNEDLYQGLKAGEFCYVLNSRQMGKSSVWVQTMQRVQAEQYGLVHLPDNEYSLAADCIDNIFAIACKDNTLRGCNP